VSWDGWLNQVLSVQRRLVSPPICSTSCAHQHEHTITLTRRPHHPGGRHAPAAPHGAVQGGGGGAAGAVPVWAAWEV